MSDLYEKLKTKNIKVTEMQKWRPYLRKQKRDSLLTTSLKLIFSDGLF
jgi:hypothetical protein